MIDVVYTEAQNPFPQVQPIRQGEMLPLIQAKEFCRMLGYTLVGYATYDKDGNRTYFDCKRKE